MNQVGLREVVKSDDDRRFEITVSNKRGRAVEVWTMQAATQQLKTEWVARIKKLLMNQFFSIRRTYLLPSIIDRLVNLAAVWLSGNKLLYFITLRTILSERWQALQSLYNSQIYEKDAEKRCVLRFDLNICEVLDHITSDGRLFRVFCCGYLECCESSQCSISARAPPFLKN